jgi:hypothetical protein
MPITINGTGTLTGLSTAGAGIAESEVVAAKALGNGGIIQVKNAVKKGYQSFHNGGDNTFIDITDLSVTITPTSSSNQILIGYQLSGSGTNNSYVSVKCVYNVDGGSFADTVVSDALSASNGDVLIRCTSTLDTEDSYGLYKVKTRGVQFIHAPASTGTLIYKLQLAQTYSSSSYYTWVNRTTDIANKPRSLAVSNLTVMEVVA